MAQSYYKPGPDGTQSEKPLVPNAKTTVLEDFHELSEALRISGNATRTLLQNISVLSAGQDFKKDNEGKPVIVQVVNLLVTPEQAEMLSLAGTQMTVQLVLRNPLDTAIAVIPAVSLASIFSGQAPPVARGPQITRSPAVKPAAAATVPAAQAPPSIPDVPHMEIISGSARTEVKLQKNGIR